MITNPYEHYEGCPALIQRPDRVNQDPCSCEAWFDHLHFEQNKKLPKIVAMMKKIRFKEIIIKH